MWFVLDLLFINIFFVGCQKDYNIEKITKEPLPEFRRRVEEIIEDTEQPVASAATITDDPNQNIVSFLIQNVKEIFQDAYDSDSEKDLETQTKTVNELRRKEKGDFAYYVDLSDKSEEILNSIKDTDNLDDAANKLIAQEITDNSEIKSIYRTSPVTRTLHTSENIYNLKLVEKQNSGRKYFVEQEKGTNDEDKAAAEQKYYQKSTLLFRPTFQIVTSPDPDTTPFYYNTRPTKLVISEFMNVSQSKCSEDSTISSQSNDMAGENEVFDEHGEFKIIELDPLPFLSNRKTAEGLLFLSNRKEITNAVTEEETTRTNLRDESTTTLPIFDSDFDVNETDFRRSCIKCDNVAEAWCSAPKHKLIPSEICLRESDICYSMHTPFGIVERGCYNVNYNDATYVCGGNICNYIAFADLPVIYISKQEWIRNVYELSRLRSLRKTTMRNLRCLKCEVNSTIFGDVNYNNNCLEGNIEMIRLVQCEENELCGIKVLKSQGYIWRGCIATPLFNYYITLCDSDLCNIDPIVSLYDKNE